MKSKIRRKIKKPVRKRKLVEDQDEDVMTVSTLSGGSNEAKK